MARLQALLAEERESVDSMKSEIRCNPYNGSSTFWNPFARVCVRMQARLTHGVKASHMPNMCQVISLNCLAHVTHIRSVQVRSLSTNANAQRMSGRRVAQMAHARLALRCYATSRYGSRAVWLVLALSDCIEYLTEVSILVPIKRPLGHKLRIGSAFIHRLAAEMVIWHCSGLKREVEDLKDACLCVVCLSMPRDALVRTTESASPYILQSRCII